jgi:hypothetical protein
MIIFNVLPVLSLTAKFVHCCPATQLQGQELSCFVISFSLVTPKQVRSDLHDVALQQGCLLICVPDFWFNFAEHIPSL